MRKPSTSIPGTIEYNLHGVGSRGLWKANTGYDRVGKRAYQPALAIAVRGSLDRGPGIGIRFERHLVESVAGV